ncbi:HIT family protein [Streptomyces fuscigenes]|uniref:HIT family protein n=1 Tax=Streptomyces fuscigenes TaxID=1528880 RepID=UPI001F3FEE69|nr:HIT domain-containing protein [Streptomyces fuscigenes]MCF3960802.1 HIT domain-containing protein [Streptomyces fuscigenes]
MVLSGGANCIFCAIVEHREPALRVFESSSVLAFLPLAPAAFGHTLIIPKRHVGDLWEITKEEMSNVMEVSLVIAHAIKEAISPDGLNLINSSGAAATQTVPHFHVHLMPRRKGDSMGRIWPESPNWKEGDLLKMAHMIRVNIEI